MSFQSPIVPHALCHVGGRWTATASGRVIAVHNPATGERLAEVPSMSAAEATLAVEAASAALRPVPTLEQRRAWLSAIAESLIANREELGRIITLEHGKPLREGVAEVNYSAGFFSFFAENIEELGPRAVPRASAPGAWTVHHRPVGVAGLITPWNFPVGMIAKKLAGAIAGGCPSVVKPSSRTPLSMIALFTLIERDAAPPPGFVNLVIGPAREIAAVLCVHDAVRMISFTGSTETGAELLAMTAPGIKRVSLELGGNAPFIVFDDADLERAADQLIANKFRGGGQTCVCTNRVLVQRGAAERFAALTAERAARLRVGDGSDPATDIGPLIDRAGWRKVRDHVSDALAKGAVLVCGEEPPEPEGDARAFHPPTVLRGVTSAMRCRSEETFGPLVPIMEFADEAEAVREANGTSYGLAAYVFTADAERARRVVAALEFGHVGVNTGSGPTPEAPFGGMKESGIGREGGLEGLHEFTEPQTVCEG